MKKLATLLLLLMPTAILYAENKIDWNISTPSASSTSLSSLDWYLTSEPQSRPPYWEEFSDGDCSQIKLMSGITNKQIGVYTFNDGKFWTISNGKVSTQPSDLPINVPEQRIHYYSVPKYYSTPRHYFTFPLNRGSCEAGG